MPRAKARHSALAKASQPLAGANERYLVLEKSGLSLRRRAELVAKSVAELEGMLGNPDIDPFARIAAAKTLIRDVAGIQPGKTTASVHGSQAPVVINIGTEPPAPSSKRAQAPDVQAPVVIDWQPNAP